MTIHLTEKQAGALGKSKPHKYNAKAIVVDGIRFPSQHEAERWAELQILKRQGAIINLRRQVIFKLHVSGVKVTTYRADFHYQDSSSQVWVVEDAKGVRTAYYKLKKKMFEAEYLTPIIEV